MGCPAGCRSGHLGPEGVHMSHLWAIVQAHLDKHGVREAAVARKMGTVPQTLNSWKKRGVRQLPSPRLLQALARVTETDYLTVLVAALQDTGHLSSDSQDGEGSGGDGNASSTKKVKGKRLTLPQEVRRLLPPG